MTGLDDLAVCDVTSAWPEAAPLLSILVPTYDHDVVPLCRELLADMSALPSGRVELLVLIDGNPQLADQSQLLELAEQHGLPACLARASANLGRSGARNRLARLARGRFLHFLDADSLPDAPGFVGRTIDALQAQKLSEAVVLCGGRTGQRVPPPPKDSRLFTLHSRKREWIPADQRNLDPAGCFLSANFVVAKCLFLREPFDDRFNGWGWEDTEWALRIGKNARIVHFDNSVSHMEHHSDATWIARIERAAGNYALLYQLHPQDVEQHRIFPLIKLLRPLHGFPALASALRCIATNSNISQHIRLFTLKILQALQYHSSGFGGQ